MKALLNIALRAARDGASVLTGHFDRPDRVKILETRGSELITTAHQDVEKTLLYHLQKIYPQYGYRSSATQLPESGATGNVWFLHPLIGTANFLRGTQGFLLGLSCQVDGQLQIAVFIDPLLNEEFTAIRGSGASMNGHRIRVSNRINLEDSTCAMEFAPGQESGIQTRALQQALEQQVRIRTTGNEILDLAMASAGRLDGGIIPKPPADQLASVALLLREAGGLVSDIEGNPKLQGDQLVFGNPKYFKQLLQLARQPR